VQVIGAEPHADSAIMEEGECNVETAQRVSSQACLGLSAGVGKNSGPRGSRGSP
jgi:hypothetical protein